MLESDADEQLLIFVPFTGDVKLKSITLAVPADDSHPTKLKVFTNREGIDFDLAESLRPVQEWDLAPGDGADEQTYETR